MAYKNIYLIGHTGCGKSTVAPLLAEVLKKIPFDIDAELEQKFGTTISEFFKKNDEKAFRNFETVELMQTTLCDNLVVATGGGVVKRERNLQLMHGAGIVIYLEIDIPEQLRRLTANAGELEKRPLFAERNPIDVISEMHKERNPLYQSEADIIVNVSGLSADLVVHQIIYRLKKYADQPGDNKRGLSK